MKHVTYYKEDYPRPQMFREEYKVLNGEWNFAFDYENILEHLKNGFIDQLKINVPYNYQTMLSGINIEKRCDTVWYSRNIDITSKDLEKDVLLHLEGSDYKTSLFVNSNFVGSEEGGYHRISFNITSFLKEGVNNITIKVEDDYSTEKPRGKQRWKDENFGCWYTDTTGIYKPAWLEFVNKERITDIKITPNVIDKNVSINVSTNVDECNLKGTIYYYGNFVKDINIKANQDNIVDLSDIDLKLWEVGDGNLYEIKLSLLKENKEVDTIQSYFGMRNVCAKGLNILLNNKVLYQKLMLDQGYFQESGLAIPSMKDVYDDIDKMIKMGFNGARLHQKIEDERKLYLCDALGFITWCEMPSMYSNTILSRETFKNEWIKVVNQYYNHPSIIVWVPFNESWGIEGIKTDKTIQDFVNDVYHLTKSIDKTRFVITNDGWEHTISDILTIHHYDQSGDNLYSYFDSVDKCLINPWPNMERGAFADGYSYNNQPIMITEFGGTAFNKETYGNRWGYGEGVNDDEEFLSRFKSLIDVFDKLPHISGYCYTQTTDVEHEVNGLLYFDHKNKFDLDKINKIINKK